MLNEVLFGVKKTHFCSPKVIDLINRFENNKEKLQLCLRCTEGCPILSILIPLKG